LDDPFLGEDNTRHGLIKDLHELFLCLRVSQVDDKHLFAHLLVQSKHGHIYCDDHCISRHEVIRVHFAVGEQVYQVEDDVENAVDYPVGDHVHVDAKIRQVVHQN